MRALAESIPRPEEHEEGGAQPAPGRVFATGAVGRFGAAVSVPSTAARAAAATPPGAAAHRQLFNRRRPGSVPDTLASSMWPHRPLGHPPAPGPGPATTLSVPRPSPAPTLGFLPAPPPLFAKPVSRSYAITIINPNNGSIVVAPPLPARTCPPSSCSSSVAATPRARPRRAAKKDTAASPTVAAPRPAPASQSLSPGATAAAHPLSPPAPKSTGRRRGRKGKQDTTSTRGGPATTTATPHPTLAQANTAITAEAPQSVLHTSTGTGWVGAPTCTPPPGVGDARQLAEAAASLMQRCRNADTGQDERQRIAERARELMLRVRGAGAGTHGGGEDGAQGECVMCFDETADTVLMPCGHLAMCFECCEIMGVNVREKGDPRVVSCPMCRRAVEYAVVSAHVPGV
ncbi:hypothetical protein DFP73DRAFT_569943 [Morchella snyderi]|nr:hypothetical protein DFP73DRAFT_569943 [Morchella snyderi]